MGAREKIRDLIINLESYINEAKEWVAEAREKIDQFTDRLKDARDELADLERILEGLDLGEEEPEAVPTTSKM